MQALEKRSCIRTGSSKSADPELKSSWALNVCEQGYFVRLRRGEPTEYSGDPILTTMMRDLKEDSGVESNFMDYGTVEDEEGSPRRNCRWARLPAKYLTMERNTVNPQIPSNLREELSICSTAKDPTIHKDQYGIRTHAEEKESDERLIHRTVNKPATHEKFRCPKPPQLVVRWVRMQDCKRREVPCVPDYARRLVSSLQGESAAPSSGADTIQNEPTVEKGQDRLDTGEPEKRPALPASTQRCENVVYPGDDNAEWTKVQHQRLHEEKKLGNLKLHRTQGQIQDEATPSYLGWYAESLGCTETRPSTPAREFSSNNDNNTEIALSLGGTANFRPKPRTFSAIPVTRRLWKILMEGLKSAHPPKPLVSSWKMLPVTLMSPPGGVNEVQWRYRRARKGLKSHSRDTKRESQRTGTVMDLIEIMRQQISFTSQNTATSINVNISVTPTEKSGEAKQINSNGVHSTKKPVESKSIQTPKRIEMKDNQAISKCQLLATSTQTDELPVQKPLKLRHQAFYEVSTISKEAFSAKMLQTSKTKPKPQEHQSSKSGTTPSSDLDTSPSFSDLPTESTGLRHWLDVIPELDNWISEVVSGWLGTEGDRLRNFPEATLVTTVSSRGTASVGNISKHQTRATPLKLSSQHGYKTPPGFRVMKVGKLLDIQMKRLAELDSRVSKARSVDDLSQILEGVSSI